jgi:hypothetical protein
MSVIKTMHHAEYMKALKTKSIAELKHIIRDAHEAIDAMPDGPNAGFYADEVSYAAMELNSRKGPHKKAQADRGKANQYNYKSWNGIFTCPICGRASSQNLNFLGRRAMMCDGVKWTKEN